MESDYPVRFDVDYPERDLNRLSTFLRFFYLIPIWIVLILVSGNTGGSYGGDGSYTIPFIAGGIVVGATVLMILFREKYPRWWFDWNLELTRFGTRVGVYGSLLNDEYPSTDEHQSVHLEIDYPDVPNELGRGMPLVKWLLAIPHYIVLFFLAIAAFVVIVISWFAILFTGRYPRDLFDFVVGVYRWALRVQGYMYLLVTDKYPPFSLNP